MRLVYFARTVQHQVERPGVTLAWKISAIKRAASSALQGQEVEQVHSGDISPLEIIQDKHQWSFCRQGTEVVGNGAVQVTPLDFWTQWLRLREIRKFEAYFGGDFSEVNGGIPQYLAQLLRVTRPHMCADDFGDWLVREQTAHFVAVTPEYRGLLPLLAPTCKLACEARFANARLATDEESPSLPMVSLAKSSLQTGNFLLATHQLCLQNLVRVDLAGSILSCLFSRRDQSGLHGAAFFKLMSLCIRGWSCILRAGRYRRQRAAAT